MDKNVIIRLMWQEIQDLKKELAKHDVEALRTIEGRYSDNVRQDEVCGSRRTEC